MKLNFIKVNPVENMTVFITDSVPRNTYRSIAKQLMNYNNIHAEQVGFLEEPSKENSEACKRLHMMGDEFCANATRALATFLVFKQCSGIIEDDKKFVVPLEVSGVEDLLYCEVEATDKKHKFISTAKLPTYKSIQEKIIIFHQVAHKGTLITFSGIVHFIVSGIEENEKESFFKVVKDSLGDLQYEALGIMFYQEEEGYMEPLVYVKATESVFWERGCGSGTAALGLALAYRDKKSIDRTIRQPGGALDVIVHWENQKATDVYIKGIVEIVAEGVVYL
ncbi:MAG: diaminopimelate epimerase [Clostridiaceae bacterium]|nr:diaminopimelate epimerase [Clostridiaceae bacterium]